METSKKVEIVLTCPDCGGTEFIPQEDGTFRCHACGSEVWPELMGSIVREIDE